MSKSVALGKRKELHDISSLPMRIYPPRKMPPPPSREPYHDEDEDTEINSNDSHEAIRRMILQFPPEIRINILEWIPIPDLEYDITLTKKMDIFHSKFVFSTQNRVISNYSDMIKYFYGYFRGDPTRHIYLFFPSLRISASHEIPSIPHFGQMLPRAPNLTRLSISKFSLTKDDVPYLPKSLTCLTICTMHTLDWSVIELILDTLPNLYYLYLHLKNVEFTPDSIRILKKMCRLTHLGLFNCNIDDTIASILLDTTQDYVNNIQELIIPNNNITGEGLAPIRYNTTIRTLRVSKNNITEKGTEYLRQCKSLEEISVDQCNLRGPSLGHLIEIPTLKRIWCRQNYFDTGFENVAFHTQLSILNLHDNKRSFDVNMMRALSKCKSLHTLVMNKCHLKDEHIIVLLEGNTSLRRLYINWNDDLTMKTIEAIAKNKSLYKLAYSQHTLDDEMLKHLILNNTSIEVLNVPFVKKISNKFLPALKENRVLKTLKIRDTPIDEEGIEYIKKETNVSQLSYGDAVEKHWIRPGTDLLQLVD